MRAAYVFLTQRSPEASARERILSSACQIITRSPFAHVSIGDGRRVCSLSMHWNWEWTHPQFEVYHQGRGVIYRVPCPKRLRLHRATLHPRVRVIPSVWAWASGRLSPHNCLGATVALLAGAGASVPSGVTTVRAMHRWCEEQNFERAEL